MSDNIRQKDPDAIRDFPLDYSAYLTSLGEGLTIVTSTWTVPDGITEEDSSFTDTSTTIRLSGGTDGADYELLNHVALSDDQEDEFLLVVQVRAVEIVATTLITTVGGSTSNSYVTLSEAKTYFLRKLYTDAWDGATDEERENALLMATMRLDQLDYVGSVVTEFQALKWPREDHKLIRLTNEQQLITKSGTVSGGLFTITHDGQPTSALAHNASSSQIQTALEVLTGSGNVFVEGGPISSTSVRIIFQGSLAEKDIAQVTVNSASLIGGGSYVPSTELEGGQTMIPKAIKEATYEMSYWILATNGGSLVSGNAGDVDSLKIGNSVEVKYASGTTVTTTFDPTAVEFSGLPISVVRHLAGLRLIPVLA
jgi:hypothetical protein